MQIAVTGGSGRVGSAVTELALAQGHRVVSIDRTMPAEAAANPDLSFIQADITSYQDFEQALQGCDALIHLAAIPSPGRNPDYEVHNNNVVGSYNALRAAAEVGITKICQASSINAIGSAFSRQPRYDYFPVDELHPTYNEDPYSLSKWICEMQGDSFARRYEDMTIASLRFHAVVPSRDIFAQWVGRGSEMLAKHLWGYTLISATARSCLLSLSAQYKGHEAFFIVAPDTMSDTPSLELAQQYYPNVPVRGDLSGHNGFFDCSKAERLLGWRHNDG